MSWVPPGRFDEYRLIKALGQGSMGQVWLAHDTVLDRMVAVKFISELPDHDAARQRFLTEARAAARIQHPNIMAIYRVGEIGPRPYLIAEYIRGDSLDRIARPVAWPLVLEIALGLARGLAAAHHRGVLHRDLKPANAILSDTGEVKLLDFGLAKLVPHTASPDAEVPAPTTPPRPAASDEPRIALASGSPRIVDGPAGAQTVKVIPIDLERSSGDPASGDLALPPLTSTGAAMGTPPYMPPEVWRGDPATPRSDVYSLGALLYELAAGTPPHRGDSQQAVRSSALETNAPPLATAVPGIDPRFAAIVDRCLRREPEQRFASGGEVCAALDALAGGAPTPPPRAPDRVRVQGWRVVVAAAALAALGLARLTDHRRDRVVSVAAPAAAPGSCPDGMVPVPAGAFRMGSPDGAGDADEHPQHEVTLSAYCIDRTEVTVATFAACAASGACRAPSATVNWPSYSDDEVARFSRWCNQGDRPDHPINCVDWAQAAACCAWRGSRLPSEAEWEYAARGGDDRIYPWGNQAPSPRRLNACGAECTALATREAIGWKAMHDGDDGWPTTAPVGRYPDGASPFGVLDMAGNVWEWTGDWYGPYPTGAQTDPGGPATGTSRVSRGGSWSSGGTVAARAADRDWIDPMVRDAGLGFRCARTR